MAITFTASGTASTKTQGTGGNVTPALPTSPQDGDLFILCVTSRDNSAHSVTAGWTQIYQASNGASTQFSLWYAWYQGTAPDSALGRVNATPTVTHSGTGACVGRIAGFRGTEQSGDPINVHSASLNATGTSVSTPAITPTVTGGMFCHFFGAGTANTPNALSGASGITTAALAASNTSSNSTGRACEGSYYSSTLSTSGTPGPTAAVTCSAAPTTTTGWAGFQLVISPPQNLATAQTEGVAQSGTILDPSGVTSTHGESVAQDGTVSALKQLTTVPSGGTPAVLTSTYTFATSAVSPADPGIAGAFLVAFVSVDNTSPITGPDGTWTVRSDASLTFNNGQRAAILTKDSATGSGNYTFSNGHSCILVACSGVDHIDTTATVYVNDTNVASPQSVTIPQLTTTASNALLIGFVGNDLSNTANNTFSDPAPYTAGADSSAQASYSHCASQYLTQASPGLSASASRAITTQSGGTGGVFGFQIALAGGTGSSGMVQGADATGTLTDVPGGAVNSSQSHSVAIASTLLGAGTVNASLPANAASSCSLSGAAALATAIACSAALSSATLRGSAAVTCSMPVGVVQSGTLAATGALSGTLSESVSQPSTLSATASATTSMAVACSQSATFTALSNALTAAVAASCATSGTVAGAGAIATSIASACTVAGTTKGAAACSTSHSISVVQSGTVTGTGAVSGTTTASSAQSATIAGAAAIVSVQSESVNQSATTGMIGPLATQSGFAWTTPTPSGDSRVIYVAANGSNSNDGLSSASPKLTVAAGKALLRKGYPDWLLLRKGDSFSENIGELGGYSGRSATEPLVIWAYGTGARPVLKCGTESGAWQTDGAVNHLRVMGIDFYSDTRDPNSPTFSVPMTTTSTTGFALLQGGDDVIIEDCRFRFFAGNMVLQYVAGQLTNSAVRRCILSDAYFPETVGHSEGCYFFKEANLLIEECIFNHNGWYDAIDAATPVISASYPNGFNHNTYWHGCDQLTARGNISIAPASIHFKLDADNNTDEQMTGTVIENNLFVGGEVGLSIGGNAGGTPNRFVDSIVRDNCIQDVGRYNPTARNFAWGIDTQDNTNLQCYGNLIFNETVGDNNYGIYLNYADVNCVFRNNVLYNIGDRLFAIELNAGASNNSVHDNQFQRADSQPAGRVYSTVGPYSSVTFSNNQYYTNYPAQFAVITGTNSTYAQWVTATGDTGSTTTQITYSAPTRTVESYNASLGGPGTLAAFTAAVLAQSRDSWDPRYEANAVNNYLRAGFDMPLIATASSSGGSVVQSGTMSGASNLLNVAMGSAAAVASLVSGAAAITSSQTESVAQSATAKGAASLTASVGSNASLSGTAIATGSVVVSIATSAASINSITGIGSSALFASVSSSLALTGTMAAAGRLTASAPIAAIVGGNFAILAGLSTTHDESVAQSATVYRQLPLTTGQVSSVTQTATPTGAAALSSSLTAGSTASGIMDAVGYLLAQLGSAATVDGYLSGTGDLSGNQFVGVVVHGRFGPLYSTALTRFSMLPMLKTRLTMLPTIKTRLRIL